MKFYKFDIIYNCRTLLNNTIINMKENNFNFKISVCLYPQEAPLSIATNM